jgi:hypothetical protein
MENVNRPQIKKSLEGYTLFIATYLLMDVSKTIRDIHTVVAVTLRYVSMGVCIVNNLIRLLERTTSDQADRFI